MYIDTARPGAEGRVHQNYASDAWHSKVLGHSVLFFVVKSIQLWRQRTPDPNPNQNENKYIHTYIYLYLYAYTHTI